MMMKTSKKRVDAEALYIIEPCVLSLIMKSRPVASYQGLYTYRFPNLEHAQARS